MPKKRKLLTIPQAAQVMGIPVFALRRRIASGEIKVRKVRKAGGGLRWLADVPPDLRRASPGLSRGKDVQWVLVQEKGGEWFWLKQISPNFSEIPISIRIKITIPVEEDCVAKLLEDRDFMPGALEEHRRLAAQERCRALSVSDKQGETEGSG